MSLASAPGTAPIKNEFLIHHTEQPSVYDDDAAEELKRVSGNRSNEGDFTETKKHKKAQRGQNKGRRFGKVRDELELCWRVGNGVLCEFGEEYASLLLFSFFISTHVSLDVDLLMTFLLIYWPNHPISTYPLSRTSLV